MSHNNFEVEGNSPTKLCCMMCL